MAFLGAAAPAAAAPRDALAPDLGNAPGCVGHANRSSWNGTAPASHPDDVAALRALYLATGGGGWTRNACWLNESIPVCWWDQVACEGGRVQQLRLASNNLVGALDEASLAGLAGLEVLQLGFNPRLGGPLPKSAAALPRLKHVYGGGLASSVGGDVVLRRAVVSGNVLYDAEPLGDLMMGGAGVAAAVGPLVIEDSLFVGNSAGDGGGGGVAARQGGLVCANCTFAGNDAAAGGAALLEGATTHVFEGAAFLANVARADGGALALGAGGPEVHVRGRAAFERNVAGGDGGAVHVGEDARLVAAPGCVPATAAITVASGEAEYLSAALVRLGGAGARRLDDAAYAYAYAYEAPYDIPGNKTLEDFVDFFGASTYLFSAGTASRSRRVCLEPGAYAAVLQTDAGYGWAGELFSVVAGRDAVVEATVPYLGVGATATFDVEETTFKLLQVDIDLHLSFGGVSMCDNSSCSRAMRAAALLWWCCVPATGLVAGRRPSPRRALRRAAAAERLTFTFADVNPRAPTGLGVAGEPNATTPWRAELYPTGFSRAAGERDRCSLFLRRGDGRAVDATFTARLVGDGVAVESEGGGGRFASARAAPGGGERREFGLPLVVPALLARFLDAEGAATCEVDITVFERDRGAAPPRGAWRRGDARAAGLAVGDRFVPVWTNLDERRRLGELGCYGGVDFVVAGVTLDGAARFDVAPGSRIAVRPLYPLVARLERPWPATLPEAAVPLALAPASYTALTAASAVGGALAILGSAALAAALFVSLSVVPTRSMEPGIAPGDVLLVEKTSSLLRRPPTTGEVVLFAPPPPLRAIAKIADDRALYVKRVAAVAGDVVAVDADGGVAVNGARLPPRPDACDEPDARAALRDVLARARREGLAPEAEFALQKGEIFVLGDCADVSVDSRVWGPLDAAAVRARPVATVYRRGR